MAPPDFHSSVRSRSDHREAAFGSDQTRTVLSSLPERAKRPSCENATQVTLPWCPVKQCSSPMGSSRVLPGAGNPPQPHGFVHPAREGPVAVGREGQGLNPPVVPGKPADWL